MVTSRRCQKGSRSFKGPLRESIVTAGRGAAGNRLSSMTDGTSYRFEFLSIALQFIHGATDGPPGRPGPVFRAGDLPDLVADDARDLGRLFPRPRIGG